MPLTKTNVKKNQRKSGKRENGRQKNKNNKKKTNKRDEVRTDRRRASNIPMQPARALIQGNDSSGRETNEKEEKQNWRQILGLVAWLRSAESLNASQWHRFATVALPHCQVERFTALIGNVLYAVYIVQKLKWWKNGKRLKWKKTLRLEEKEEANVVTKRKS